MCKCILLFKAIRKTELTEENPLVDEVLAEGSELKLTQPALVLEQIIGQLLFSSDSEEK